MAHANGSFSFEFFPPKTEEGREKLRHTTATLGELAPAYISVTFGAGGSTQDRTIETVFDVQESGIAAAPHLSCIGATGDNIREILETYRTQGINRIVALRGDMPSGGGVGTGDFRYANELVEFIRKETGDHFQIEVAAYPEVHPQAANAREDLINFQRKVAAGADAAITQYFYNADAYFHFVDQAQRLGVEIPIVPGIMPITNYSNLVRFSDMCGAEIPRWIRKQLEGYGDDIAAIRAFGKEVTLRLCQQLLEGGAPGLHFYSMNQVEPSREIWLELGLS